MSCIDDVLIASDYIFNPPNISDRQKKFLLLERRDMYFYHFNVQYKDVFFLQDLSLACFDIKNSVSVLDIFQIES